MPVVDLLERAAGTDVGALREWKRLERGLEALFPGTGRLIVRNARNAGLDPFAVDCLDFNLASHGEPVLQFRACRKHRHAFASRFTSRTL